jgi:hypothetical protein
VVPLRRQNRAGAREGIIADDLQHVLLNEAHRLGGLVDAVDRIKAVNDFFEQLDFEL